MVTRSKRVFKMADKKKRLSLDGKKQGKKLKRRSGKTSWSNEQKEISELEERRHEIDVASISEFSNFPISKRTLEGLNKSGYSIPTDIQIQGIAAALRGSDVLGAAKTGSGKTLAFLIPVIETLWRQKWSSIDGMGALIISPTRELAYQTFEVIVKIGSKHDLSAGLVIGGKDLKEERNRISMTNIVVCTPGRLLQHMDETPNFECTSLQILVLDEADRILDMGFASTLNAIIENLPAERQTLLFSATQTKSVKDLARLSLKDPEYISVHENSISSTPKSLTQSFVICELPDKLNFLYSFIRHHLKSKVLVFVSSCKQVKYIYESFCRLRPGVPLMALYGKQKQLKRVGIYDEFCRKRHCVLFATDIAARGLDFPAVNWVVQLDCPEDANTYIHRAGRTARYERDGQSLLVLMPSEEQEMLKALEEKKVPINRIRVNPKKLTSIKSKLDAFCAQNQDLKHWAQRTVVSYVRSVFLQPNKKIFNAHKLPVDEFALSLGLPNTPRIRFMKKAEKKFGNQAATDRAEQVHSVSRIDIGDSDSESDDEESDNDNSGDNDNDDDDDDEQQKVKDKRLVTSFTSHDDTADQDDQVLFLKRRNVDVEPLPLESEKEQSAKKTKKITSRINQVKKILNKKIKMGTKILFDDDGQVVYTSEPQTEEKESEEEDINLVPLGQEGDRVIGGISVEESRILLQIKDKKDRERERKRIREEHKKKKRKLKPKQNDEYAGNVATLAEAEEEGDYDAQEKEFHQPRSKRHRKEKRSDSSEDEEGIIDNRASIIEDEELALHLLNEGWV